MTGKIIKGIAGFYYVHDGVSKVYECKAKGVFRSRKIKPLVGDNVELDVLSEEQSLGNIVEILPRENSLIRPAVANIDQAMIVFAVADPEPNLIRQISEKRVRQNDLLESIGMPDMMSICPVLWRGKGSRRSMTS